MVLKMKNVKIMEGHQMFRGGGSQKSYIYGELPKKGRLAKNREEGVLKGGWYLDAHYDLILVYTCRNLR